MSPGAAGYDPTVMRFGYTLMTEQAGARQLVRDAVAAEHSGFDFEVMSDHHAPWLASQGHAPYAWSVLGAVAHATRQVGLASFVTCPTTRYHPAVVAQKAATVQELAEGRFTLGLGSGERLNEHVVGRGWPGVHRRHDLVEEAVDIITELLDGGTVTYDGEHYTVEEARIWDLPDDPIEIGIAVSGPTSIDRFAPAADHMIAVAPDADLVERWNGVTGASPVANEARAFGQLPISWDPTSRDAAIERAHDQFRWFAGGWQVNADLATPGAFEAATKYVRPEDVAASIPCGPDLDAIVDAVRPWREAGFTDLALVQIGGETQDRFLTEAAEPLLRRLREDSV